MSGASCQAALHGCLPAETAAIYFAAPQHTPETNPLREAVVPRRRNPFCFQKKRIAETFLAFRSAGLQPGIC
jgi:hypothetical protein